MLKKAGVEVRYEQLLDQAGKDGARITELRVQGGEIYRAKVFIDATYEGDLMAKAGVSYSVGRESAEQYGESIAGVRYLDDKVAISPFDDVGQPRRELALGQGLLQSFEQRPALGFGNLRQPQIGLGKVVRGGTMAQRVDGIGDEAQLTQPPGRVGDIDRARQALQPMSGVRARNFIVMHEGIP